jgi:hypothetical protein
MAPTINLLLESTANDTTSKSWEEFATKLAYKAIKKCGFKADEIQDIDVDSDPQRRVYIELENTKIFIRTWDIMSIKKGIYVRYSVYEDLEG